jgi:hypothetical protein
MRPILYLDLDDSILYHGMPVHNSQAFFEWVTNHFEVRWLTNWIPSGEMNDYQAKVLSMRFEGKIGMREFQKYNNPRGFGSHAAQPSFSTPERLSKLDGIDLSTDRPWIWVENELFPHEKEQLVGLGLEKHHYITDLKEHNAHEENNPIAITWAKLKEDFKIE